MPSFSTVTDLYFTGVMVMLYAWSCCIGLYGDKDHECIILFGHICNIRHHTRSIVMPTISSMCNGGLLLYYSLWRQLYPPHFVEKHLDYKNFKAWVLPLHTHKLFRKHCHLIFDISFWNNGCNYKISVAMYNFMNTRFRPWWLIGNEHWHLIFPAHVMFL